MAGALYLAVAMSLSSWERGLKLEVSDDRMVFCRSLSSWERGLKPVLYHVFYVGVGRSLRGSVD